MTIPLSASLHHSAPLNHHTHDFPSSMHPCLRVYELLHLIASYEEIGPRDLINMTLTCTTFHGPANDLLWEALPGLRPLLSLLPEDSYRIPTVHVARCGPGEESEIPGRLIITRIPRREEWTRVQDRAQRVRILEIIMSERGDENEYIHTVSYESMNILRDHYQELVLFPNLRALIIEGLRTEPFYKLFMSSPNLRCVGLDPCLSKSTGVERLVPALDAAKPLLDLLVLRVGRCNRGDDYGHGIEVHSLSDTLSKIIRQQARITVVSLPSHISEEAFVHLAHTPSLRYLAIDFYDAAYRGTLKPSASHANFANLKILDIHAGSINRLGDTVALTSFLGAFKYTSSLVSLRLEFSTSPMDTSLPHFFTAVSLLNTVSYCTLECIPLDLNWNDPPVSADILEPLYQMKGMRTLDLSRLPMDVSPDAVSKMASAWPDIESIELGQEHPQSISNLTLGDLDPFVIQDRPVTIDVFGAIFLSTTRPGWVAPPAKRRRSKIIIDIGHSNFELQDAPHSAAVLVQVRPSCKLLANSLFRPVDSETPEAVAEINRLKDALVREALRSDEDGFKSLFIQNSVLL